MEIIKEIDAVEGFNSRGKRLGSGDKNRLALELAQKHNVPVTAGSDAHFLFEIGRARCIIEKGLSAKEVKQAILNGEAEISGKVSSIFVEPFSQLIKMIKLKQPLLFLKGISKLIYKCLHFKRGN
jgi:hypothetical protein